MGLFGGSSGKTSVVTKPWDPQDPYLIQTFKEAKNLYQNYDPQWYPGQAVAGIDPRQQAGMGYALNTAIPQQQQLFDMALRGFGQASAGQNYTPQAKAMFRAGTGFGNQMLGIGEQLYSTAMDPYRNPSLPAYQASAIRPVYEQLTQSVLPAIRSGAAAAGQYGSSRQGIAEGLATQSAQRTAGDITAKMGSDAYERGLEVGTQAMQSGMGNATNLYGQGMTQFSDILGLNEEAAANRNRALALTPLLQSAALEPSKTAAGVGDFYRNYEQALIDSEMAKWNWQQALPYQQLAEYQNLVSGAFGGSATSSLGQPGAAAKIAGAGMGALTGGLAGGMLQGAMTSGAQLGAIVPGWGMAIGAGLGLLSAFM